MDPRKKKRSRILAAALGLLLIGSSSPAWATSEVDALLNKLVEKGILSSTEAQDVRNDMAKDAGDIAKAREADTKDVAKKMAGGSWLDKVKWGGDLRLRHESQWKEPAVDRHRERFRLRFGFKAKPVDPLEIGVQLASGGTGDPLSTNQSFNNTFDKKPIVIDKAYAKYTPWSWVNFIGGKMDNPFVTVPEGNVFDGDVTPEGVAAQWKSPSAILTEFLPMTPFLNVGGFSLQEISGDGGDPGLFGFQAGTVIDLPQGMTFQPAVGYYDMTGIKGLLTTNLGFTSLPGGNSTVTTGATTHFKYDYNMVDLIGKFTIPEVFGKPVSFVASWTHNPVADDNNNAWQIGTEVGKVSEKFGSWNAFYYYKQVEHDAVFAGLTDSDFGGGGTNHFGHILGMGFGLNKYASLGLKYFRTDEIDGAQAKSDTLQADVLMKF